MQSDKADFIDMKANFNCKIKSQKNPTFTLTIVRLLLQIHFLYDNTLSCLTGKEQTYEQTPDLI